MEYTKEQNSADISENFDEANDESEDIDNEHDGRIHGRETSM